MCPYSLIGLAENWNMMYSINGTWKQSFNLFIFKTGKNNPPISSLPKRKKDPPPPPPISGKQSVTRIVHSINYNDDDANMRSHDYNRMQQRVKGKEIHLPFLLSQVWPPMSACGWGLWVLRCKHTKITSKLRPLVPLTDLHFVLGIFWGFSGCCFWQANVVQDGKLSDVSIWTLCSHDKHDWHSLFLWIGILKFISISVLLYVHRDHRDCYCVRNREPMHDWSVLLRVSLTSQCYAGWKT